MVPTAFALAEFIDAICGPITLLSGGSESCDSVFQGSMEIVISGFYSQLFLIKIGIKNFNVIYIPKLKSSVFHCSTAILFLRTYF